MDRLPSDTRDILLTPEFVAKSDRDIKTIASLNDLALRRGAMLALSGGYATEAHCGGKIVRPHGDIDARFIFETIQDNNGSLFNDVGEILNKEDTEWRIRNASSAHMEYIEDDDSKAFFNKRRLEVRVPVKGWYEASFQQGELVDSGGRVVKVMVLSLTDLVKSKIQKLYEVRKGIDTAKDRHTSVGDYYDLKRLLALKQLDKSAVFEKLAKAAKSPEKAQEQWDYATSLLS